jgi:hypothetical protein
LQHREIIDSAVRRENSRYLDRMIDVRGLVPLAALVAMLVGGEGKGVQELREIGRRGQAWRG